MTRVAPVSGSGRTLDGRITLSAPGRQRVAREDPSRFARFDDEVARSRALDRLSRSAGEAPVTASLGADGVTIVARSVKRRVVDVGDDRLGQDQARGFAERNLDGFPGLGMGQDPVPGFIQ